MTPSEKAPRSARQTPWRFAEPLSSKGVRITLKRAAGTLSTLFWADSAVVKRVPLGTCAAA